MEKLGNRVIYCDTDSIINLEDEYTKTIVKMGKTLGEWSDELGSKYFTVFAALAPNDYGGILNNGEYKGKIKGLKIDGIIEQSITHENRIKLLKREINAIICQQNRFIINYNTICTKDIYKLWTYHFDKRIAIQQNENNIETYPYGHNKIEEYRSNRTSGPVDQSDLENFMIIDAETNKELDESHCYYEESNKKLDESQDFQHNTGRRPSSPGNEQDARSESPVMILSQLSIPAGLNSPVRSLDKRSYIEEPINSESNIIKTLCDGRCGIDPIYKTLLHHKLINMNFSEFCLRFGINEFDYHWRTDDELRELCISIHNNLLIIGQNTQTFYVYNNGYNFYMYS